MRDINVVLKIVVVALAVIGFIATLVRGWQRHEKKLQSHDDKLEAHEENMKKMSEDFKDDIEKLNKKVDGIAVNNREDHRLLFTEISPIAKEVAKMSGYMLGKNEGYILAKSDKAPPSV